MTKSIPKATKDRMLLLLVKSMIRTILKHKEVIKHVNIGKGVKVLTKQKSQAIVEVEKALLIWINEKQLACDSISEAMICAKAKMLKDIPGIVLKVTPLRLVTSGLTN